MGITLGGFEWDNGNTEKCQKHGVSVAEIESVFQGTIAVFPALPHSGDEERFKAIGRTGEGRYVFVVFTLRYRDGQTLIRPISARYMHRKEIVYYEKAASEFSQR